jgi:hypothetical protein
MISVEVDGLRKDGPTIREHLRKRGIRAPR